MKLWIARDEDGDLFLYNQKPSILKTGVDPWDCFQAPNKEFLSIPNELFPEITFENSPQEVELKLKNELSFEEMEELIDDLI